MGRRALMLLDWLALKHFKKHGTSDKWGDPDKLDALLLMKLDDLREFIDKPIHVTSGYRAGDLKEHGAGRALDVVCPTMPLFDFYLAAERFGFTGLGVYAHWKWDGVDVGGLHLDQRVLGVKIGTENTQTRGARWFCYKDQTQKQIYTTLNEYNLKKYKVI